MNKQDDLELIEKACSGDTASFADLADRHYLTVYRYAFRWAGSREDAEDIAQEVFIKLAGKMHLFDKKAKFTTWLYRMTANCAVDFNRKNRKWQRTSTAEPPKNEVTPSPAPGPEKTVITRSILSIIDTLPIKQKEAVLLVFSEGMSHKEAAGIAGCAETTISWRIFQAKRTLRKVLS